MSVEDFIILVRVDVDSMAQRLGLRGPKVTRRNTCFLLGYFGERVGIEFLVEFDYFFVYAMPFRILENDLLPEGLVDASGVVYEMYLHEALDKLRIPHKRESDAMKRLGGKYSNCQAITKILVDLVERTWGEIVANADKLFP